MSLIMWVVFCVAVIVAATVGFMRHLYSNEWASTDRRSRGVEEQLPPPVVAPAETESPTPAPAPAAPFGEFSKTKKQK
ncbi:MAG: hypothetical protein FJ388_01055 [Verrucomicrobia bacterium]|nr:hypothetical protein [Verrucomicrobiota bacterium]